MDFSDIIMLLSGVALFLFGMSVMGDGLQKSSGNKLEPILFRLTSTMPRGVLLGALVTAKHLIGCSWRFLDAVHPCPLSSAMR